MPWSRDSMTLLSLGLLMLAGSFCSCGPLTRLKALEKSKDNSAVSLGQAERSGLYRGTLLIEQISPRGVPDSDDGYQADMGWAEQRGVKSQSGDSSFPKLGDEAVERLLRLDPRVECTGDSMRLKIQDGASTPGSLFLVDQGKNKSPLPLSKLPANCGYTVMSTRKDFVMAAPYDGCYVAQEDDCYVLPLRLCGVPVRMSCPSTRPSAPNPPTVICEPEGMVVKTTWIISVAKINVYVEGEWLSLMKAAAKCGFGVVVHPKGVDISVRYTPCLEKKDGLYTLQLSGEGETNISCHSLNTQTESTRMPPREPESQKPGKGVPSFTTKPSDGTNSAPHETKGPQPGGPQVPVFPLNPQVPSKSPNQGSKDTVPPQMPYNPWIHHLPYTYPEHIPVATIRPPATLVKTTIPQPKTTLPPSNPEVPQQYFIWPTPPAQVPEKIAAEETPEEAPKSPVNQSPHYYPYHYYFRPPNFIPEQGTELPTAPPAAQPTEGQRQQFYPIPWTHQATKQENPAIQPPVTNPPVNPGKNQKPQEPPSSKSEPQENKPQPIPSKTQAQIYPFYQNPFFPQWPQVAYQTQMPPMPQMTTHCSKELPSTPVNPVPSNPEELATKTPPQTITSKPQAPKGQVYYYPYFHPAERPNPIPEPSQPAAPPGKVPQQFPQYFPHPYPQTQPVKRPELSNPLPSEEMVTEAPTEKPVATNPPKGQIYYPFPLWSQPTSPPATPTQISEKTTVAQPSKNPSNGGQVPQNPPSGSQYVYCPQACPSGLSNCCVQIAFHQHLHHFLPPGSDGKNVFHPAMAFLQYGGLTGLGNELVNPLLEPTVATATKEMTPAPTTSTLAQPPPPETDLPLPQEGNDGETTQGKDVHEMANYAYFAHFPYQVQSLPDTRKGNAMVSHHIPQSVPQMSQPLPGLNVNPSWSDYLSYIGHITNQKVQPRTQGQQPSYMESSYPRGPLPAERRSVRDRFSIPYPMPHDAGAPVIKSSRAFVSGPKKSSNDQTIQSRAKPEGYMLLQEAPPGWDRSSYDQDLDPETTRVSQGLKPEHHSLNPLQEKRHKSESWPVSSLTDDSPYGSLPKDRLNPEFLDKMWEPTAPLGASDSGIPNFPPVEGFPSWEQAAGRQMD